MIPQTIDLARRDLLIERAPTPRREWWITAGGLWRVAGVLAVFAIGLVAGVAVAWRPSPPAEPAEAWRLPPRVGGTLSPTPPKIAAASVSHAGEEAAYRGRVMLRREGVERVAWACWWLEHGVRCQVVPSGPGREWLGTLWLDCPAWSVRYYARHCSGTDAPGREWTPTSGPDARGDVERLR